MQYFPPDMQEEIANYIEALVHRYNEDFPPDMKSTEPWQDPVGSLSDLPNDMFEELDRIRHSKY